MTDKQVVDKLTEMGCAMSANDSIYESITQYTNDYGYNAKGLCLENILKPENLMGRVEMACEDLLDALLINWRLDHNTHETPRRMAKMFVTEVFKGRYTPMPEMKEFPNAKNVDQICTLGPITIRSTCSHHMVPIEGHAWVGVLPEAENGKVLGLSKFVRLSDWIFSRPQIQEEATEMLSDVICKALQPRGLAIVVRATHKCMTWRGVRETDTTMVTSSMRGAFKEDAKAREEFFNLIKGQGY